MSDYTSTFTESTGDTIDTTDFSTEFDAIETASATKLDKASDTATSLTATGLTVTGFAGSVVTMGTPDTSTGVTSITFGSIPSWVKKITIMIDDYTPTGADTMSLQIGDAGGIETAAYLGAGFAVNSSSVVSYNAISTSFTLVNSIEADSTVQGQGVLSLIDATNNIWSYSGMFVNLESVGVNNINNYAGSKALSATLTQIKFLATTNITAGTFNIQYEG